MNLSFEQAKQIIDQKPLFDVNIDISDQSYEVFGSILTKLEQIWDELQLDSKSSKKGYNITIDLLKNALNHGYNLLKKHFAMTIDSGLVLILTENYIHNQSIPKMKEYLDFLNSLDRDGYKQVYKEALLTCGLDSHSKGFGLLDIKRKSDLRPILYHFSAEENGLVLFSIISTFEIKICENNPV